MAKVYVGTYAKYNSGSLDGAWLDLADYPTYDDFVRACRDIHRNEHDPEFMIQDYESFPDGFNCTEWLGRQDFDDIKLAMKEEEQIEQGKPAINIIDYSEKSFAVVGDTKAVKDSLKKMGGSFNSKLSCGAGWIFPNAKRNAVLQFISSGEVQETIKKAEKPKDNVNDNALLDEYMKEWEKVWPNDKSMLDYERKKFSSAIRLQNGGILYFEKPSIKTEFCFHDEGPDYEFYCDLMKNQETKLKDYFLRQNLDEFDEHIAALNHLETADCRTWYIQRESYCCESAPLNLWRYIAIHWSDMEYHPDWHKGAIKMNDTDRKAILAGLKHERDKFEKRLQSYLKRYGTSKLHTWTYWADR